jgi:hypothetical protein
MIPGEIKAVGMMVGPAASGTKIGMFAKIKAFIYVEVPRGPDNPYRSSDPPIDEVMLDGSVHGMGPAAHEFKDRVEAMVGPLMLRLWSLKGPGSAIYLEHTFPQLRSLELSVGDVYQGFTFKAVAERLDARDLIYSVAECPVRYIPDA